MKSRGNAVKAEPKDLAISMQCGKALHVHCNRKHYFINSPVSLYFVAFTVHNLSTLFQANTVS